jgi:hypothetical protein
MLDKILINVEILDKKKNYVKLVYYNPCLIR